MIIKKLTLDGSLHTYPRNINNIHSEQRVNLDLVKKLFRDFGIDANIKLFEDIIPVNPGGDKLVFNVLIDITPKNHQDVTLTRLDSFLKLNGLSFTGNIYIESKF